MPQPGLKQMEFRKEVVEVLLDHRFDVDTQPLGLDSSLHEKMIKLYSRSVGI
jgi:hypothetical protein